MKMQSLIAGALLLSAPAFAQVQAPLTIPAAELSGYDLLLQAGKTILPGPNGNPTARQKLTPDENLKRQRLAVARNAPALTLVRQALQKPIEVPLTTTYQETLPKGWSKVGELADQFFQEADVRLADGDVAGAMNSRLDIIDMGVGYEHGSLMAFSRGADVEDIGRIGIGRIASRLDATQCRAAIERLKVIDAKRPSYTAMLNKDLMESQNLKANNLAEIQKESITTEGEEDTEINQADVDAIAALTPEKVKEDAVAAYAPILENATLPYQKWIMIRPQPSSNPLFKSIADMFVTNESRFWYEECRTSNMLLSIALELHAQKLEAGAYPDTFVTPPDPFSPDGKPLVYKKTEEGYLLYSVGPDGKDDNGGEIKTMIEGEEPGNEVAIKRLTPESTGDIVQRMF